MPANQQINEAAVDQRVETVTTQQPGDATTEEATRDTAAGRRQWVLELTHVVINNWIHDN
jgi:hypothetical protein